MLWLTLSGVLSLIVVGFVVGGAILWDTNTASAPETHLQDPEPALITTKSPQTNTPAEDDEEEYDIIDVIDTMEVAPEKAPDYTLPGVFAPDYVPPVKATRSRRRSKKGRTKASKRAAALKKEKANPDTDKKTTKKKSNPGQLDWGL